MQSPEVHNFPAPESLFNVEKFQDFASLTSLNNSSLHYNHCLTVIIPGLQKHADNFFEFLLEKGICYKVSGVDLENFANVKFISSFIRDGKLTLLSINKRIDCDTCIGITADGKLHLSLDRETYQSVGIEGAASHFTKKLQNRYLVSVDLADEKLLSNESKLQRLKSCLGVLKKFTIIVSWEPPEKEICPSSVAKFFADLGYPVKQCIPTFHSHTVNTQIPQPDFTDVDKYNMLDVVEWLGMIALGCNLEPDPTNYLSSYVVPNSVEKETRQVMCFRVQGFFSKFTVEEGIEKIRKLVGKTYDHWIAIYVQGFSDCPVAWGNEEHHYYTNGDNGYILFFSKDKGLICTQKCSRRRYK